ncbi:hypothetical protein GQX74_006383 [Glossina fuscipes]|nr:hypothetical protein GQX74_006383 [Glossina fuscipes]
MSLNATVENFANTNDKSIPLAEANETSPSTKIAKKRRWRCFERGKQKINRDPNEALPCQYAKFSGHIRLPNQEEGLPYNGRITADEETDFIIRSVLKRKHDLNSFSTKATCEPSAKRSLLNVNSVSNSSIAHHQGAVASNLSVNNGDDSDNDIATVPPYLSYKCDNHLNLNDCQSRKEPSCNVTSSTADIRRSIVNSVSNSIKIKKNETSLRTLLLKRKLLSNVKAAYMKASTSNKHVLTVNVDKNANQTTKHSGEPEVDMKGLHRFSERSKAITESKGSDLINVNRRTVAYSDRREAGHVYQERKTGLLNTTTARASRQSKPFPSLANLPNFHFPLKKNDPVFAHNSKSGNISPQPVTALTRHRFNDNLTSTDRRIVPFSNGQRIYGSMGEYNKNKSSVNDGLKRAPVTLIRPNLSLSNLPTCLDSHLIISNAAKRILSSLNGSNALVSEAMKIANKFRVNVFHPSDGFNKHKSKPSNVVRLSRVRTPYSRQHETICLQSSESLKSLSNSLWTPIKEQKIISMTQTLQKKISENLRETTEHNTDATTILPIASAYTLTADDESLRHINKIRNKTTNSGRSASALGLTGEASTPPTNLTKIAFLVMETLPQFDTELTVPSVPSGIAVLSKQQETTINSKFTQDDQSNTTLTTSNNSEPILATGAFTFYAQDMKLKDIESSKVPSIIHFEQDDKPFHSETHWKSGSVLADLANDETLSNLGGNNSF